MTLTSLARKREKFQLYANPNFSGIESTYQFLLANQILSQSYAEFEPLVILLRLYQCFIYVVLKK